MATLIVKVAPYQGEYEIPTSGWTNRELHFIKQTCGVRAGELDESTRAGDVGVLVALTAVILKRNGHANVNIELLWDANEDDFDVRLDDAQEDDADRPPATATVGGNGSAPDVAESESESEQSSGAFGALDGESSQPIPSPTGNPGSETSVDFDPTISQS